MFKIFLILVILLQVADIVTTYLCLRDKKGTEANRLLAPLFDRFGVFPTLLIVKLIYIGWVIYFAPQTHVNLLALIAFFYCWVIFNNVRVLLAAVKKG